ncbi:MAG: GTPase Era [Mucinivorans sp.]
MFHSGFVNIVGNPNVGKSTLMNALVGEKISIITSKAQTTRHRIRGIVTGDDFQIVFSDTPGVLKPAYKLQDAMLNFSTSALTDADVLIYVTDVVETGDKNPEFLAKVAASGVPIIVLINKIDLSDPASLEQLATRWMERLPTAQIVPISATLHFGTDDLLRRIVSLLPEAPPYFDKEVLTDKSLRFFASEIIREQILTHYDKEIPYSSEVVIEAYQEEPTMDRISAVILVARASQKGIIIGHQGLMLKKTGTAARKELEEFLGKKVFLEIFVKVDENWRDNDRKLKNLGYSPE